MHLRPNVARTLALMGGFAVLAIGWYFANFQPDTRVTGDKVASALLRRKPTVVEFGANACAACREMKPILHRIATDHGAEIEVLDIDVIKEREYLARYRVRLMPTQVFYDARGREIARNEGPIELAEILARLGVKP